MAGTPQGFTGIDWLVVALYLALMVAIGALAVLLLQPYMLQKWLDVSIAWPWWWVIVTPVSLAVCIVPASAHAPTAPRT